MDWKKKLTDAGILLLVFIAAVIGFSLYTNKGNANLTADMGAATFPQISFSYNGYTLNTLNGYAKAMDIPVMRDVVTPVTGQQVSGEVRSYDNRISSVEYIVYSLDGKQKLKNGILNLLGENFTLDFADIGLSEERVLELILYTEKDEEIYFYTRIADATNANILECLDYIRNFHENAMGKVEGTGVGMALEPSERADNTNFRHVTIQSDYNHVSWGGLEPMVEMGERWSIKEIRNNSVSVQLEYRVRCKGEENETDVYLTQEFFRVSRPEGADRTYLLDYDRTMEQIFDVTKHAFNERGLILGIVPKDVQYLVDEDGLAVSFVAANELWNYNKKTDEVSLVFSFADVENTDVRNMGSDYRIRLLDMDGKGNTVFAVCGYMSRGVHEGEVGVAVYYYDIEKNSVEEKVFITTGQSYGIAIHELSNMLYYNVGEDLLYVLLDGALYEFNVRTGRNKALVEGLKSSQYVLSDDGSQVSWQAGEEPDPASAAVVKDLEAGEERTVECEEDECILPLGFIKDDFVYGVAKTADTGKTISGEFTVPMYKVEIRNRKNEVVKTYQMDGIYVLDAVFEENMITLIRATRDGETYASTASDYITNNEEKEKSNIYVETYVTDLKETQVRIVFDDGISDKEPKVLKPKQILLDRQENLSFDDVAHEDKYYVYGYGELRGIYDKAGEAIRLADEYNGVVVDTEQNYIWAKGINRKQHEVVGKEELIQSAMDRLRQQEAPADIMKDLNNGRLLDLTGCTAEQMISLLDQNIPVIGMLDTQNAVILVGYVDYSLIYIQAETGERRITSTRQMDEMTSASGNTYVG